MLRTSHGSLSAIFALMKAMKCFDSSSVSRKCFCAVCVAVRRESPALFTKRNTAASLATIVFSRKFGKMRDASCQIILVLT